MLATVLRRVRTERGASAAEYALLGALVAVVILASVTALGTKTAGLFAKSCQSVASATSGSTC